jgi:hypothetical protein
LKEDGEEASHGELKENEGEEAMELDPASMRRLKEDGLNFPFSPAEQLHQYHT